MSNLSGPALDTLTEKLRNWYVLKRQELIKALSESYPYGSIHLHPAEQVSRFDEMKPQDYEALIDRLNEQYRGMPNSYELVSEDLANFMGAMIGLKLSTMGYTNAGA